MAQEQEAGAAPAGGCAALPVEWMFQLNITSRQFQTADVVPLLLHVVNQLGPGDEKVSGKQLLVLS